MFTTFISLQIYAQSRCTINTWIHIVKIWKYNEKIFGSILKNKKVVYGQMYLILLRWNYLLKYSFGEKCFLASSSLSALKWAYLRLRLNGTWTLAGWLFCPFFCFVGSLAGKAQVKLSLCFCYSTTLTFQIFKGCGK